MRQEGWRLVPSGERRRMNPRRAPIVSAGVWLNIAGGPARNDRLSVTRWSAESIRTLSSQRRFHLNHTEGSVRVSAATRRCRLLLAVTDEDVPDKFKDGAPVTDPVGRSAIAL